MSDLPKDITPSLKKIAAAKAAELGVSVDEYVSALLALDLAGLVDHTDSLRIGELHPLAQEEIDRRQLERLM